MNRFRFTLQAVLTVRERKERTAMEQYAGALRAVARAQEQLRVTQDTCRRVAQDHQQLLTIGAVAAEVIRSYRHSQFWEERLQAQVGELRTAQARANDSLRLMLAARRQREAVDQFQARQRQAYHLESNRLEQKLLDEWAQRPNRSGTRPNLTSQVSS